MQPKSFLSRSLDFSSQEFHYRTCGCDFCRLGFGSNQENGNNPASSAQEKYLSTGGLISDRFSRHTSNALHSTGGEILPYFIYDASGYVNFDDRSYGHSLIHSGEEKDFIRNVFNKVDGLIDIDFEESSDWNNSVFDIYSLESYSEWDNSTVGEVNDHGSGSSSYWDIYWKDTNGSRPLNSFDSNTIIHEIGHALGLSHPYEDPFNTNWTTDDTIMSYNVSPDGWDTWFSDLDIAALIEIWGVENDNGFGLEGTDSNDFLRGTTRHDIVAGFSGSDQLIGRMGKDTILGYEGNDLIRAGSGRDYIWGGSGADQLYGGVGHNTFGDERDGFQDRIYFKSDQFAYNWFYGKAGNNPTGQKVDVIKGLDANDKIYIQGIQTNELSFSYVNKFTSPTGVFSGVGIFANGFLEGIYTGGDLNAAQLQSMTVGVAV